MARDIDDRKKRRALRKLRRAAELADQGLGPPLSDWEQTFLEELEERIETYGSAFADPTKGDLSEPLSALQQRKLKEIDRKARGKEKPKGRSRSGLGGRGGRTPDPVEDGEAQEGSGPAGEADARPDRRPAFRVIEGGKRS